MRHLSLCGCSRDSADVGIPRRVVDNKREGQDMAGQERVPCSGFLFSPTDFSLTFLCSLADRVCFRGSWAVVRNVTETCFWESVPKPSINKDVTVWASVTCLAPAPRWPGTWTLTPRAVGTCRAGTRAAEGPGTAGLGNRTGGRGSP